MLILNITQKHYTKELNKLQLKMNFDVGVFIPQYDSVRLLRNIVKEMDFSKVYSAYSDRGRKPVVSPVTMFQIIVYAYIFYSYESWNNFKNSTLVKISHIHRAINP